MKNRLYLGLVVALAIAMVVLLGANVTLGQDVTATVTGTVTDPSGSPIVGATVTAEDKDRGTAHVSQTDDSGVYNVVRIPVGNYTVKVEAKGFQTSLVSNITLVLNQTARIDVAMKVGQVSEFVEVSGEAPVLKTDAAQLDTIIDAKTNVSLPLASRNYVQLTLLSPGAVHPDPSSLKSGTGTDGGGRPYINGNREQSNNFLLDGMDNNQVSDNLVGYTPSVDAIQEFNMITSNASAEFGNFQGGIISATIKSGTNGFHGDVFEFLRNDKLNANSWANNSNGLPKPAARWNMFGATIGGPIIKNKLFFFADYQGQRFDFPASAKSFNAISGAERTGDFSALCTGKGGTFTGPGGTCTGGTGIQLYNPFSLVGNQRSAFAGNIIPAGMEDPVAAALFASTLYPTATGSVTKNNTFNEQSSAKNNNQGDLRMDWNLSDKDRIMGRYSQGHQANPTINSILGLQNSFDNANLQNFVVTWTHNISPNMINEARAGVNYIKVNTGTDPGKIGDAGTALGIANSNAIAPGLLALQFSGGDATNIGNSGVTQLFADSVFQYEDGLIITRGKHVIHAGFQYYRQRINSYYAGNNGQLGFLNYSGRFTSQCISGDKTCAGSTKLGAGEADFFLGLLDSEGRGIISGTWGQRANIFAPYVQDDWRITNHLTLNLGVRYEAHTPWVEIQDRQLNFSPISGDILVLKSGLNLGPYTGTLTKNRALYDGYYGIHDFQPRIGFAWSPAALGGKTVFRGAYTISSYQEGTGTNLRPTLNPPFGSEFQNQYFTTNLPPITTADGLQLSSAADPFKGAVLRLWDPHVQPAIVQQWNLSVQHQLNTSTAVQLAYVGEHGSKLMVPVPYLQKQLHPDGTITPSPFLSGNPALQADIGQISGTASIGYMAYNALQATLKKNLGNGLEYQVAYTYSKCMTDSSGYYGSWGGQAVPTSPYFQNLYDERAEKGPCYYDVTHDLTTFAVYELPVGRGKHFGKDMNSVANAVIGGWQVSPIWTWRGGFPLTISGNDNSKTNSRGARANCNAAPHVFGTRPLAGAPGLQWFDPSPYSQPTSGFGTCGIGTVRGPGLNTWDLSLQKSFPFTESKRVEFRTEFINLFNHPIFASPGAGLGASLGQITNSQGERNIQFSLKLVF
jgi:hypothetical protein